MTPPAAGAGRRSWWLAGGVAGAAVLLAGVTVLARAVGFGRWVVFSASVGELECLSTAYLTANMVPTILFEVVAGGALASAVVPLLARPVAQGDREHVRAVAGALLGWTLVVLLPLALVAAALARPAMSALLGGGPCTSGDAVDVATVMFVLLAPQLPLYGLAVVLGGVLNAHRSFLAPALAPLLSSLVVVTVYAAFGLGYDGPAEVGAVGAGWVLVLALGTTAGVLALALTSAVPVARMRLGLRPTLRFPPGVAARARGLALAGLAALVAQQLSVLVVVVLANRYGGPGALSLWNYAWAVFLLPYAVLAVPLATAAFPALSEHAGTPRFAGAAARSTRAVLLAGSLGAALLAGVAAPAARVFQPEDPEPLARALVAFAPGLVGFALVAHLGRALHALGAGRLAAAGAVTGWLVVVGTQLVLVPEAGEADVVAALGVGTSVGLLLAGSLLTVAVRSRAGRPALAGALRAAAAGLAAAVVGASAARLAAAALPDGGGRVAAAGEAGLVALVALAVFAAVAALLDREDASTLVRRAAPQRGGARA